MSSTDLVWVCTAINASAMSCMNKEIMAKVNEILKANGTRELSMDEMDQVSGGWRKDQLLSEESEVWNELLDEWRDAMGGNDETPRTPLRIR